MAIGEGNWNVAFTLLGRMARARPSVEVFRRLSHISSNLQYVVTTCVYLLTAIQAEQDEFEEREQVKAEWAVLQRNLLASSTRVTAEYEQLSPTFKAPAEKLEQLSKAETQTHRLELYAEWQKDLLPIELA